MIRKPTRPLAYRIHDTPIGPLTLAASDRGLAAILLPVDGGPADPPGSWYPDRTAGVAAAAQIDAYFSHDIREFHLDLDLYDTPFRLKVWAGLRAIPFGEAISYKELAARIGQPGAVRAVGQANGANPMPLVIPCHRVVAAGGAIGGFSSGLDNKRALLAHEGVTLAGEPPAGHQTDFLPGL